MKDTGIVLHFLFPVANELSQSLPCHAHLLGGREFVCRQGAREELGNKEREKNGSVTFSVYTIARPI